MSTRDLETWIQPLSLVLNGQSMSLWLWYRQWQQQLRTLGSESLSRRLMSNPIIWHDVCQPSIILLKDGM